MAGDTLFSLRDRSPRRGECKFLNSDQANPMEATRRKVVYPTALGSISPETPTAVFRPCKDDFLEIQNLT